MWFLRFSLFDENDPRQSFVLIFQREEGRRGREWDTNYDTKDTMFRFTSSLYYFILFHGCFGLFFVCVPVIAFCKRTEVKEKKRNRKTVVVQVDLFEGGRGRVWWSRIVEVRRRRGDDINNPRLLSLSPPGLVQWMKWKSVFLQIYIFKLTTDRPELLMCWCVCHQRRRGLE